jgi:hypothetical protein
VAGSPGKFRAIHRNPWTLQPSSAILTVARAFHKSLYVQKQSRGSRKVLVVLNHQIAPCWLSVQQTGFSASPGINILADRTDRDVR